MEVFHWEQEDAAYLLQGPDLYLKICHYILKVSILSKKAIPRNPCLQGPMEWQKQYVTQIG